MELATLAAIASISGISAKKLVKLYQKHLKDSKKRLTDEILANRIQLTQQILSKGLHTQALYALYPDLKSSNLSRFTIKIDESEVNTSIVGSPEQLLCEIEIDETKESHSLIHDPPPTQNLDSNSVAHILADIKTRGLNVWDQGIYRLHGINISGGTISAQFSIDRFMRYRLGIGSLLDELFQALIDTELNLDTIIKNPDMHLPIRTKLLPNGESVAQFNKRMCAGGIHATVALQRPDPYDDFVIPIQRRSFITSEGQNMISTIPQAFHQPTIEPEKELNIVDTFFRELYEELFGGEEAIRDSRRLRYDWYKTESKEIRWLIENNKHFRLILTGFGLNLISGNYEFALLLVIRNPFFWDHFSHKMVSNWEATEPTSPLISTKDKNRLEKLIRQPEWTGTGLFSLSRGLQYLGTHDPKKVNLPNIKCECL